MVKTPCWHNKFGVVLTRELYTLARLKRGGGGGGGGAKKVPTLKKKGEGRGEFCPVPKSFGPAIFPFYAPPPSL